MAPSNSKEYYIMETIRVRKLDHSNLMIECDSGQGQELNEFFSFFVPGYKFMPAFRNKVWDGKIRLFNRATKQLPVGLYYHLLTFCRQRGYMLEAIDSKYGKPNDRNHINPEDLKSFCGELNLPFDMRDYQFDCVGEAITRKRAILLSPTGSGKSLIIYAAMRYWLERLSSGKEQGGRVLVIVPTTSLVEQMHSDFINYGWSENEMHKIYSGKDRNNINATCVITTWQSVYKLPPDWFKQFGCVIGDECHGFKSKSLMTIMNKCTEAEYRFGTTGTLDGAQTHELVLQGLFGKIYRVTTTKSLQDNNTLAKLEIKRIILTYPEEIRKDFGKRTYQDEIDFIVSYDKRNRFIRNLALDMKGNTLILYNYVEKHGKPLFNMIEDGAGEDRKVFFVSGDVGATDREAIRGIVEKQKNAILVASLGTFSTGINIKELHNIIFASPSKSQIRVLQSIGRGLRKSNQDITTQLYDVIDDISWKSKQNYCLLHSNERLKIYQSEQFDHKSYKVNI